jgi:RNA polymerase sigma-70 factor (sigma-E family)
MPRRDDATFGDYVGSRREHLRRTAYLLCGDWHQAEDLVQVTLTKLYVAWPRVARDGREDAYARRILVNTHIDDRRRPWRRESTGLGTMEPAASTGPAYEERDALRTALLALPESQRRIVVLRHWWGVSVEEAAADLGVSTGTIKSQTSRALARLNQLLASDAATKGSA